MARAKLKKSKRNNSRGQINPYDNNSVFDTNPGGGTCCCPPGCWTRHIDCCGSRPRPEPKSGGRPSGKHGSYNWFISTHPELKDNAANCMCNEWGNDGSNVYLPGCCMSGGVLHSGRLPGIARKPGGNYGTCSGPSDYWCQDNTEWEDCGDGTFEKTGYNCEGHGWIL